ncbi:hypothetical protein MH928_14350 [Flavobacterium sp. WW92]|uniref:hypothetical protein n=1 Tax=unclassified Flavobacterium TaxID=196869 RepID=UPI002224C9A6|nr:MULTISPECIES: hypothetical protein [unclassified Flavobacterium]WDO12493.1 hypothetical protein MH928_14350 [Flavobacterium sp. WW92]
MSKYRVFYLDDEKDDLTQPIKKKLEANDILEVSLRKPHNFENELDILVEQLKSYNALILDLQLNGPQENTADEKDIKFQVRYQAPPLAQMIRTLASEGLLPDLPIILCSTEDKIKDSFTRDFTSHDLFDWTFLKDDIDNETVNKISSLIDGYQILNTSKKDFSLILKRDYKELDERMLSRFVIEENPPIHEIARVIFKDIIQPTGVLISEETLAARLGINIYESKDWSALVKFFLEARYDGIFHNSWNRWWNDIVIDVFENMTNENLASLNAESRVTLLREKTGFNDLKTAKPIELFQSSNYWNICEITRRPLDPFEGFKICGKGEPKPWQDYAYVSLYAIVEEPDLVSKKGIKVHPTDIERLSFERKKID